MVVLAGLLFALSLSWPGTARAQTLPTVTVAVTTTGSIGVGPIETPTPACLDTIQPLQDAFLLSVAPPSATITLNLSWGGTAVPGVDYLSHPDTVVVPSGTTSVTVPVSLINQPSTNGKTIVLTINNGSDYSVGTPANATATIEFGVLSPLCVAFPPPVAKPNFTG
jgi:hypothetical protein